MIALTKLDVLGGMGDIKVCTAYELDNGDKITTWPTDTGILSEVKPVYETLPGWNDDISGCKSFDDLPENAKSYINYIERALNTPIVLIGTGADRTQTINRGF